MITTTIESSRSTALREAESSDRSPGRGVLVVDADGWLRNRICDLLQAEAGFRLAGMTEHSEEAISMAERERFDIAVVAHRPPGESGFRVCRELKRTATPPAVVICCAKPDGMLAACCAVADADALISRHDCAAELAGVLDRVARGVRFLPAVPPGVAAMLCDRLDAAEYAVFGMLLAGFPVAEVAAALRMAETELESRRSALLERLEALLLAREAGY